MSIYCSYGHETLSLLDDAQPDVVLLDVMMKGMDGLEVCRRIRANPRWQGLPVLLVTALQDRASRIRGLEAGADDFLSKPIDLLELRARVQTTVQLGRIRRQLQERERFEWVVMSSNEGFLWLDEQGRLEGANPTAEAWLGMQTLGARLAQHPWLDVAAEEFQMQPPNTWSRVQEAGEPFSCTLIRPNKVHATGLWLHTQGAPLPDVEGNPARWMVHLQDVTYLQSWVQQSLTLVHLMAHKLRTPLTLIRGPIDLIAGGFLTPDDPDWPDLIAMAMDRFDGLVNDVQHLLNMAEAWDCPAHNTEPEVISPFDIQAMLDRLRQEVGLSPEQLVLDIQTPSDLVIQPLVLEAICGHLLDNAVKFHPTHSPQVTLFLHYEAEGELLRLQVADDGPGIPSEHRQLVWRPLYQIDQEKVGQVLGMGIGLSLVANYAWNYGGKCWIEPNEPVGTRVCVELPLASPVEH